MGRALGCWIVACASALSARHAQAEPAPIVQDSKSVLVLEADAVALQTSGVTFERLAYLIGIESAVVVRASTPTDERGKGLRAFVDPTRDGSGIAITLVDATKTDSRLVALAAVPLPDRARVVALALGEMIRAGQAPPSTPPPSPPPASPPPFLAPARSNASAWQPPLRPPPVVPPKYAAELLAGASWFPQRDSAALELRGALERELVPPFGVRAELGFGVGRAGGPAGDVQVAVPAVAIGMRLRSDTRATVVLGIGPVLEAGAAFVSGSAKDDPRVQSTRVFVLRTALEGDVRLRLGPRLYGVVGASFGVMLQDVELRADDGSTFGAAGLTLGGRLGVGTLF